MTERRTERADSGPGRMSVGFAIVLALAVAAPTVGDIGSCSGFNEPLDARKFFAERLRIECERCRACEYGTPACRRACDRATIVPSSFPAGCRPLVHDGQVCLRAIEALSCRAFGELVSSSPIVPTECDFCPEPPPPEAP